MRAESEHRERQRGYRIELNKFGFRRMLDSSKFFCVLLSKIYRDLQAPPLQPSFFPRSSSKVRGSDGGNLPGGWVGPFLGARWETQPVRLCAGCEEPEHGRKSRRRKSSRTIGMSCMQLITHCPGGSCLSVAGRWLGCVLEQSTALRLRWCEAVVMMGMPRDVLRQMISRSLPVIYLFPAHLVLLFAFVCGQW